MIRNLIEGQGGLEMKDRHFYTGFVNDQRHVIKGKAAKWKMADWLVEKLDEIAEFGYLESQTELQDSLPIDVRERALLEQEIGSNQDQFDHSSLLEVGERALLEQEYEQDVGNLVYRDWIIEFRQTMPPLIGLIWGGSIEYKRRDAA